MSGIMVVVLGVGVLGFIGVTLVILMFFLRGQVRKIGTAWADQGLTFHKGPEHATYQGHDSATIPLRGSSVLGLTHHDLRLIRLVPRREFVIPLSQITQIEKRRSWKGKYQPGTPVIVVQYQENGQADAIAFSVRDPQGWLDAIAAYAPIRPQ